MRARRPVLLAALLVFAVQMAPSCNKKPFTLTVFFPVHGNFVAGASTAQVIGQVTMTDLANAEVKVRNTVVPVDAQGYFSHTVNLNTSNVFNNVRVTATNTKSGHQIVKRVVVIQGVMVPDGNFSLNSIALRLNDSGLDAVEPVVSSFVDLDLAALLPPGTLVINDFCAVDGGFLGCLGSVDVYVVSPAPTISSFGLDVDSMQDFAAGDVTVNDVVVNLDIDGSGLAPSCGLRVTASSATIFGDYALDPDAVDPSFIDVNLNGSPSISISNFNDEFTSGLCDFPLIGDLIQLIIGDIEPVVTQGLVDFLVDPDGAGPQDAPIAEGIETALAGISIAGPIGESLGVNLEAPLFTVDEDVDGITLGSDGRVTANFGTGPGQCDPPAGTPDLPGSFSIFEPFPTFGPTTPGGGLPYGMGICISTAAFNQLLKGEIECGLLRLDLTEIDLQGTGTPQPVTAGLLSPIIPELGSEDPALPLVIRIRPSIAPLLTGDLGPSGEMADLQVGALGMDIFDPTGNRVLVGGQVDFRAGLDFVFDDLTSQLVPTISSVPPEDITVAILENPIGTNGGALTFWLEALLPVFLPDVGDALGAFPLPSFLGLDLQAVELGRNGEFISIFADLVSTP